MSDGGPLFRGFFVSEGLGLMNDFERKCREAIDTYHMTRAEKGFVGRQGEANRQEALEDLGKAVETIDPFDEWRKRHD